jgi:hypothetical protein
MATPLQAAKRHDPIDYGVKVPRIRTSSVIIVASFPQRSVGCDIRV